MWPVLPPESTWSPIRHRTQKGAAHSSRHVVHGDDPAHLQPRPLSAQDEGEQVD